MQNFRNYKKTNIILMLVLCFFVQESSAQIHRWTQSNEGLTNLRVYSLTALSDKIIFTGTVHGIFCSTDSGKSWEEKSSGLTNFVIDALGSNHRNLVYAGVSGGYPPYGLEAECVISSDTGNYWQTLNVGHNNYGFMALSAVDSNNIFGTIRDAYYIYGGNHYIIKSTDGGYSWETTKTYLDNSSSIANPIISKDSLILVGRSDPPNLFRSTDLGTTWQGIYIDSSSYPPVILSFCYNDQGIFFAGTSNKIFKSTDSGITWHILPQCPEAIYTMCCEGDSTILAAGYDDYDLMCSTDLGLTWNPDTIGLGTNAIRSILQYAPGKYLVGTYFDGVYYSETLVGNETEITDPSGFSLSQNYPNPFNSTTNMNYEMARGNFISIKVYDVLGKEIETLVNEYKPAGLYTITFNGNNLSSSIYLYRIQAGSYSEVRKMILLK